ncbi:MAG TPA: GNAT family N-acetyltransferase [Planctomycetota bacterium]|nr:GNAT family N-acetyltransferase [Planctomycetota bacterium]
MSVLLREHRAGDMGWIVHRQAVLYWKEYGWGESFEALLAEIAAKFLREFKPGRERCFVAEKDGEIVGAVFIVEKSASVAQLRMLYVEPGARGLGIGRQLVSECVSFSRKAGYGSLVLWTNDVLHAARHLYEEAGFVLIEEQKHDDFGKDLTAQTWQLEL